MTDPPCSSCWAWVFCWAGGLWSSWLEAADGSFGCLGRQLLAGCRSCALHPLVRAMKSLCPRPVTLREVKDFVTRLHRHHKAPVGHKYSVGVEEDGRLCGVACVSRPVARLLDDGFTAEVTRLCTDGTANACSVLYGACRRIAKAMGYRRLLTYTLATEPGTSLRASGWRVTGEVPGRSWSCPSRPREDSAQVLGNKIRWEAPL